MRHVIAQGERIPQILLTVAEARQHPMPKTVFAHVRGTSHLSTLLKETANG
jgi:hypothetical protein